MDELTRSGHMEKPIYLDYNATTPIHPEVADAMLPFIREHFGNPSSAHWYGVQTRKAVETARAQVAALLRCDPDEIIFTSGGSEANNAAVKGIALRFQGKGRHIVTSPIEHPAILEVCAYLGSQGFTVTMVPVDAEALIASRDVAAALRPDTVLISIMLANNEVGTIQPIAEIAALAHERGILLHTDAAQAVGKIPVTVDVLGVDLLSIAGHKLYAPKGVGALYLRRGVELPKFIHGAGHERNLRAGTENVAAIVGLGMACEIAARDLEEEGRRLARFRDTLQGGLEARFPSCRVNGHRERRLPNTLSVSFPGIEANTILAELDQVACSAGAACHADQVSISHVLEAMHLPTEVAMGTLRLSLGRMTTEAEVEHSLDLITETVRRLLPAERAGESEEPMVGEIRLTRYTHGLGCACKLRPQLLERVLADLPRPTDPNVLVGLESSDDAAVYRISDTVAIVNTVDFFTPIVDDPYEFGAIAAANALSDIYAMGGKPLFALSIVGFPSGRLPLDVLRRILRGASDKAAEAGISIIGGHMVEDTEPKYGLAVTGIVDPARVLTNSRARPGDKLILTKPLGVGIICTALKRQMAGEGLAKLVVAVMAELNRVSAECMRRFDVSACTDVTGFGLLGHLKEMTTGSGVDAIVRGAAVPIIPEAVDLARAGMVPGGTENNLAFVAPYVEWGRKIAPPMRAVLSDAQTSGGLLIAVHPDACDHLLADLHTHGIASATCIGEVTSSGRGTIRVL
jgi:cysteine desulfurase NifS/selenium donor protein